jgi:hypothetical protein
MNRTGIVVPVSGVTARLRRLASVVIARLQIMPGPGIADRARRRAGADHSRRVTVVTA